MIDTYSDEEDNSAYLKKKRQRCRLSILFIRAWCSALLLTLIVSYIFFDSIHDSIAKLDLFELIWRDHVKSVDLIHDNRSMTWIPTREGLTSRYFQMEHIHSQLQSYNRMLRIAGTISVHYKDLSIVDMCDIFQLPKSITCVAVKPDRLLKQLKSCTRPPIPIEFKDSARPFQARGFGISAAYETYLVDSVDFSWSSTLCSLAFGLFFPLKRDTDAIPIKFTKKYSDLLADAKKGLGIIYDNSGTTAATTYTVAHWRRGDQVNKCKMDRADEGSFLSKDTSVNCGSAADFIAAVKQAQQQQQQQQQQHVRVPTATAAAAAGGITFVSTNEKDPRILAELSASGFKLFRDINLLTLMRKRLSDQQRQAEAASSAAAAAAAEKGQGKAGGGGEGRGSGKAISAPPQPIPTRLSSLDIFVVELQLMIDATYFLGWGETGIRGFVERARAGG